MLSMRTDFKKARIISSPDKPCSLLHPHLYLRASAVLGIDVDGAAASFGAADNESQKSSFGSDFMKDRAYIDDDDDNVQYPGSEQ